MAINPDQKLAGQGEPFYLFEIERVEPPEGAEPGKWYRYTITQGDNVITGYRKGSKTAVTAEINEIVAALNERRLGRRGTAHLRSYRPKPKSGS